MSILYQQNFDSLPAGAIAPGWANIGSANYQVLAQKPISAPNGFGLASFVSAAVAVYTAQNAVADSNAQISQRVNLSSGNGPNIGVALRCADNGLNGYFFLPQWAPSKAILIFKRVGGTYTALSQVAHNLNLVDGDTILFKAEAVGTTLRWRAWKAGTPEPTTWGATITDSAVTAAGKIGLYAGENGAGASGAVPVTVDDVLVTDNFTAKSDTAFSDANLFFSPYNWRVQGASMQTNNPGAYLKTKFSGTSFALNVDVSPLAGQSADNYPAIAWSVDGGAWTRYQLKSTDGSIAIADGLASGTHTVRVVLCAAWWQIDRWNAPISVLRVTGVRLDVGAALSAPDVRPGRAILFGDSQSEGYESLAAGVSVANQDASQATPQMIAHALDCEYGVVAFAGTGFTVLGGGNARDLPNGWSKYDNSNSRLTAGALTPTPNYLVSLMGQNDTINITPTVQTLIGAWRAAAGPSCKIIFCRPADNSHAAEFTVAITGAGDSLCYFVDTGEDLLGLKSGAGQWNNNNHLNVRGHARYAAILAQRIGALSTTASTRVVAL